MLVPLVKIPGMLSLGGGIPNPDVFPIKALSYELEKYSINIQEDRLKEGLQYSSSYGIESLLSAWKNVLISEHKRSSNYSLITTTGSQDGLAKCFDCILDREDSILVEDPTYSGALAAMKPTMANIVPVPSDRSGIIPERLGELLTQWNPSSKKPKALYIIPTGQNPGGTTIAADRRKHIYELANEHDFLIIEDDPYWFLHFQESPRPPSFFSMDNQEGRVLRLDSLSKVFAAGLRVGFVAGPTEIIDKLQLDQQASALHSSGISQVLATSILETMGTGDGLERHTQYLQQFYKHRRDLLLKYADKYLSDLATWNVPEAGMFIWFTCKNTKVDTQHLLDNYAKEEKILIVPGTAFYALPDSSPRYTFRVSFSMISEETAEECVKRLRSLLLRGNA